MSVTVYLPTLDRVGLLRRALAGLQSQTFRDWQCVVVDDGSSDETPDVLARATREDARIRVIRNATPVGACAARTMAIEAARTDYVTGLDDDDLFLPQRLESMLAAIRPGLSLVCANDIIIGGRRRARITRRPATTTARTILRRNCIGNQALFLRRHALAIGGFDPGLRLSQDYDFWIRMIEAHGPARCLRQPLQIIFAEFGRPRITTQQMARRAEFARRLLDRCGPRMSARQRCIHRARILSEEGNLRALGYGLAAFDFSRDGAAEVVDVARTLRSRVGRARGARP